MKEIVQQSQAVLITCLLSLGIWALLCHPAEAGKVMKSLAFDAASGTVEIATIYETSYAAQKSVMKSLKAGSKAMKKAPGFKGFSMLQSQDGNQVIALSQWQDLGSYQAYTPTLSADSSKAATSAAASAPPVPTRTLTLEIVKAQAAIAGATPALRGKEAVVQLAQFIPKDPEARSQLLSRVEAMIPTLLQKQPVPQSILLLKGIDTDTVALQTNWNCSALFEDVGQPMAIEPSSELVALADHQQTLFNVATIIPAEVKQDKADKPND